MKDLLFQYFTPLVVTAFGGALTSLTSLVLLKVKNWVDSKTKNENIAWALERLTHTTETVVADLERTVVNGLKANAESGKLTALNGDNVKKIAIATVKFRLKEEIQNYAAQGVNNLDIFIGEKIEQAVEKMKAASSSASVKTPVVSADKPDTTRMLSALKSMIGLGGSPSPAVK